MTYCAEDDYDDLWDGDDGDGDCTMCGGEGESECDDWMQCMGSHFEMGGVFYCACIACGGSGQASDQRIW